MYPKIFVLVLFSILFALAAVATSQSERQLEDINLSSDLSQATDVVNTDTTSVSAIFTVIKTASASESESGHGAQKTSSHSGSGTGDINSKPTSSASVLHAGVQTSLLVALGSALGGALLGVMMIL